MGMLTWSDQDQAYRDMRTGGKIFAVGDRIDPDTTAGVQPVGKTTGFTLTDSEEFNGAMQVLDPTNGIVRLRQGGAQWRTWYPDWPMFWDDDPTSGNHTNTGFDCYYQTDKVSVAGGSLLLACDKQSILNKSYRAGMITTLPESRSFLYGYFETRMRVASGGGTGNWMGLWSSDATYNSWSSEIDMCESFHNNQYKTNLYTGGSWDENTIGLDMTQWHTYGCEWTTGGITFYRDGVQTYTTARTAVQHHYLIMNSGAQASSSPTFSSAVIEIDYLRVWEAA